jgi:hypothetical protein
MELIAIQASPGEMFMCEQLEGKSTRNLSFLLALLKNMNTWNVLCTLAKLRSKFC